VAALCLPIPEVGSETGYPDWMNDFTFLFQFIYKIPG
jgi:hypothetical protein